MKVILKTTTLDFGLLNNTGKQKAYNLKLDLQKKSWDHYAAKENLILMQSYLEKLEKSKIFLFLQKWFGISNY